MKNVGTVFHKEMLDAVRDQRTLMFMIVFPLVFYPVLMMGVGLMEKGQDANIKNTHVTIGVQGPQLPALVGALRGIPNVTVQETHDGPGEIRGKKLDAAVSLPADVEARLASGGKFKVGILYDSTRKLSGATRDSVWAVVRKFADGVARTVLESKGLNPDLASPVQLDRQDVATESRQAGFALAIWLPYFLTIGVLNGLVTVAIDTTAGEKDRNTLETVLVTSASRQDILLGKLLAVVSAGLVATLASCAGMSAAILSGVMTSGMSTKMSLSIPALAMVFLLALPVAVLLGALLMAIGCFAKSAREGQSMAVGLQMVVIFAGLSSMLQQTDASLTQFLTPVLGTALVQREILMGEYHPEHVLAAVGTSVGVSIVCILMAVRLFGNERVMFRAK